MTVYLTASPDRKGSGEKPSQLRPPKGLRPSGPVVGLQFYQQEAVEQLTSV